MTRIDKTVERHRATRVWLYGNGVGISLIVGLVVMAAYLGTVLAGWTPPLYVWPLMMAVALVAGFLSLNNKGSAPPP